MQILTARFALRPRRHLCDDNCLRNFVDRVSRNINLNRPNIVSKYATLQSTIHLPSQTHPRNVKVNKYFGQNSTINYDSAKLPHYKRISFLLYKQIFASLRAISAKHKADAFKNIFLLMISARGFRYGEALQETVANSQSRVSINHKC